MHVLELKIPPLVFWSCHSCPDVARHMGDSHIRVHISRTYPLLRDCDWTGGVVSGLGVVSFRRAKTTVNPMKPESSSSLVVWASRWTRNPMYLGFLLGLLGWAIFLSNALTFFFLPAFIVYMNRFQIEPEEKALILLFGKQFAAYKSGIRRWL